MVSLRVLYHFILKLLFLIITCNLSLQAQVIPDTAWQRKEVKTPLTSSQRSLPPFANDPAYNEILTEAMMLQNIADSLGDMAFRYRQEIMFMDNVYERNRLQYHLKILEDQMRDIQSEADSLFYALPGTSSSPVRDSLLILDTIIEDIKVYHFKTEEKSGSAIKTEKDNKNPADESTYDSFSISSRPVYSSDHSFEYDFKVPQGTFYRIQLAVLTQETDWERFGGIQPITVEKDRNAGVIKYYAGKFSGYSDAQSALTRVRSSGFGDAFIVSYYNGQRMSVEQVREYEKIIR
jgi:hypothetical protein